MVSQEDMQAAVSEMRRELHASFLVQFETWKNTELQTAVTNAMLLATQAQQQQQPQQTPTNHNNDLGQSLTSRRDFSSVPKYGGKTEDYEEWAYKMKVFLGDKRGWQEILSEIEELSVVPDVIVMDTIFEKHNRGKTKESQVDQEEMNHQLFQVLSLNLTEKALSGIKVLAGRECRGFIGWYKLHQECSSLTLLRVQGLADKAYHPKRCKTYAQVNSAIDEWELSCKLFERVEGHPMSEHTKTFGICQIVPEELQRSIRTSTTLDSYEKVRNYVAQQVSILRDAKTQSGVAPMDLDYVKKCLMSLESGDATGEYECDHEWNAHSQCDHAEKDCGKGEDGNAMDEKDKIIHELMSFVKGKGKGKNGGGWNGGKGNWNDAKGKGKGNKFEGNCSYCGLYGHRKRDCRKLDVVMQQWRQGGGKGDQQGGRYQQGYHNQGFKGGGYGGKGGGGGNGKGFGLNMWELQQQIGGGSNQSPANQGQPWQNQANQGQPWQNQAPKAPWAIYNLESSKPSGLKTVSPPPGLVSENKWEVLQGGDDDEEVREGLKNLCSVNGDATDFPTMTGEKKAPKAKMPPMPKTSMGNYSKSQMRRLHGGPGNAAEKESEEQECLKHLDLFIKNEGPAPMGLHPFVGAKPDDQGWQKITAVMDSGASESVAPPGMCPAYDIVPSPGSRNGQTYTCASNREIRNMGEQVLDVVLEDGVEAQLKYQVAEVSRPLNSITEICDSGGPAGQMVVFGQKGGAIVDMNTGRKTVFAREGGVYVLDAWVKPKGFQRPGTW